ncbi:MAG TPA: hypothetical protein VGD41_04680 [Pyrinomonadaceae bacterium]
MRTYLGQAACLFVLACGMLRSAIAGEEVPALHKVEMPVQWGTTGDAREDYKLGTDRTAALSGGACAVLIAGDQADPFHFGALVQSASAASFKGKRLEFSGYIASDNAPAGAAIWMRADNAQGIPVAFENTLARGIRGTEVWTYQSIVMDVPETAIVLRYGAVLNGRGTLYVDDLQFRIVDDSVAVTAKPLAAASHPGGANVIQSLSLPEPRNLDFEVTTSHPD